VLKWLRRLVIGFFALVVVIVGGMLVAFSIWRVGYVRSLEADSQVVSTRLGAIEYAVLGEGTPYLYIHGAPGGYDQGLAEPRLRPQAFSGLKVISVSRPGYLRTPLSSGATPAEQADLFAALLDEIEVERVIVTAISAGGPSGLQFALRHPDRTAGLVLIAPGIAAQPDLEYENPTGAIGTTMLDVVLWAGGRWLFPAMLPGFNADDPDQVAIARVWGTSVIPLARRTEGAINDFAVMHDLDVENWPLEALMVPTLILHGDMDRNAPFQGSRDAAARIPNAELVTFEGVGHEFSLTRPGEIDAEIGRFIRTLNQ
jgi:2-hydroxy-6-oxonona-2,4-dienedioate hydrolase